MTARTVPISKTQAEGIRQRQVAIEQAQAAADHFMTGVLAAHDITAIVDVKLQMAPEPHLTVTLPEAA